jgi:uncharacterized RDD family membrane protein YckC
MTPDRPTDPQKPGGPADESTPGGSDLWRLLQDEGSLATHPDTPASSPAAPPEPRYITPEEELDGWRTRPQSTEDDSVEASRIRRIIESAEDAAEGSQYQAVPAPRAPQGLSSDYDAAVANYHRNESTAVACRNHPEVDSVGQCPECQAYYCQTCMTIRRGRMLCRDCAETAFVASEEDVIRAQEQGLDSPQADVAPEAPPEFQMGGFGIEGAPANPLKRLLGWALDFAVSRGVLLGVLFVIHSLGIAGHDFIHPLFDAEPNVPFTQRAIKHLVMMQPLPGWLILVLCWDFLYYFVTLGLFNRTPGMGWTGSRIVTEWGDYVSFSSVALRTLVFLVCLEAPAILASMFMPNFRGPHDLAAGTLVINYAGIKRVDAYETVQIRL